MTKEELRTDYVTNGWEVKPVVEWSKVSEIEGKTKYDVEVVSPNNDFFTAQVVVENDGQAGETAISEGRLKTQSPTFTHKLIEWLQLKEGQSNIFATAIREVFQGDTAEVYVYIGTSTVERKVYVVTLRDDVFNFKEII